MTAIWSAASLALPCPPQQCGQRLASAAGTVVDEGEHRVEPEPALEVRGRLFLLRLRPDTVASRSTTTRPDPATGGRWPQTTRRAAARAARMAAIAAPGCWASVSISRLTVG